MRRTPVVLGEALLTGALAITAGAVALRNDTTVDPVADRVALVKNANSEGGATVSTFRTLAETLPNAKHGAAGNAASDSVVVGTITAVSKHAGVMDIADPDGDGDFRNEMVPFDAPTAHRRNLKLTVAVTHVLAGAQVTTVVFDWPVMGSTAGGEDADAIGRALQNLGTVMITSRSAYPNTFERTRTVVGLAHGLAQVAADGTLSFPFTEGAGEGATMQVAKPDAAFTQGVDTVEEVRQEAAKPAWKVPPYSSGTGVGG